MTSVASFDDATTAGNFTLVFSGVRIPSSAFLSGTTGWVQSFKSRYERLTEIIRRQNFTSTIVINDGRFPAQVWEHEMVLYTETGSLGQQAELIYKFHDEIRGTSVPLRLEDGDTGNAVIEFGNCLILPAEMDEPQELLLHRAGFIRVTFLGNTRPIVNDLP